MSITSNKTVNFDTEIRKLHPAMIHELKMLLNIQDSWKKLMAIIPKDDESGKYKFNSEHFSLIEQGARQQQKGCADIFFDEWSTMGKKRPTVKKLLDLLIKAELLRAADWICINVLNMKEGPKRPDSGPAAKIDIDSSLLESRGDVVESSSVIAGDIYIGASFQNEVQNPRECDPQDEEVPYSIATCLTDGNLSSMLSESCSLDTTNKSEFNKETMSSENESEKNSSILPRCLQNFVVSSESVEVSSCESTKESYQSTSTNEFPNAMIPRVIMDYTNSE